MRNNLSLAGTNKQPDYAPCRRYSIMGLDVVFYINAEPYQCPCLKKSSEIVAHWHNNHSCMVHNIDNLESDALSDYTKVTFDRSNADDCNNECNSQQEGEHLKSMGVGGISHYDPNGAFWPGQVIKFSDADGFYFGGVFAVMKVCHEVEDYCTENHLPNPIADMNWSEGFYSGRFLYWLKEEMVQVAHLSPQLNRYKEMLESVSEEDLCTKCVLIHC